ncbi:EF-hand domain-containing protein [Limnoglobus roseus]|uniref:EF-hand domain-containing protein n=1 Tax=Limnoglobus roseus TaxID=2598579 RepID=A0A5C1ABK0_9BACT|nr:EF-hand domain-containing protein [Limnoglobus roseus]QEL14398.1 hypothetical protein PX52LOC_01286 [Limnoglobus roseus]
MLRKIVLIAAFTFGLSVAGTFADDPKPEKGKGKLGGLDKGKMFEKLDADGDGKVSKEEYKKGMEKLKEALGDKAGEKGKKVAEKMDPDKMFEKIDTNKDGYISKEEYEKFEPLADLKKKAGK